MLLSLLFCFPQTHRDRLYKALFASVNHHKSCLLVASFRKIWDPPPPPLKFKHLQTLNIYWEACATNDTNSLCVQLGYWDYVITSCCAFVPTWAFCALFLCVRVCISLFLVNVYVCVPLAGSLLWVHMSGLACWCLCVFHMLPVHAGSSSVNIQLLYMQL